MQPGQGPGLSLHDLGETGGSETVTLLESEIPAHSHNLSASSAAADEEGQKQPNSAVPGSQQNANQIYGSLASNLVQMAPEGLAPAGGDQPHNNMQPYLTFYFCIALQGVFPPRG
jgi:microcystin-dependent protein